MAEDTKKISDWFSKRLPKEWQVENKDGEALEVLVDRDEIVVICGLAAPETPDGLEGDELEAVNRSAIRSWRKTSRDDRMAIADEAQSRFGKHVSWGGSIGDDRFLFTHVGVPTMSRLKITERRVLDTLVESGVASSRSEALAWCVRYVGKHEKEWLEELRQAFDAVSKVREKGPAA